MERPALRPGARLSLPVPPSVAAARCTLGQGAISERGSKMDAGFFRVSGNAGIWGEVRGLSVKPGRRPELGTG